MRLFEIIDKVISYHPRADIALLEKAYVFAAKTHGNPPFSANGSSLQHSLGVAGILADMHLDEDSITAGMLHDTVEKGRIVQEELQDAFGPGIARIVQGVTKLSQLDFSRRKERQAEYLRKMIFALSQDIRVIMVKLADRLHDMRALEPYPAEPRQLLAQETLDIYVPLSARLGIEWVRLELEDLSFKWLHPEDYENLVKGLAKTEDERRRYIEEVGQLLTRELEGHGLKGRVTGRPKHLYSIYKKMRAQNLELQRVYDLIAFRIIVGSVKDCYEVLGMVHAMWEPVPGRFKDYIAKPKANMYQSLHTTVIGPYSEHMEVQIRTEEMNRVAKEGIAAHWLYKEGKYTGLVDEAEMQRFSWLQHLLEWKRDWSDSKDFFKALQVNLYPEEVYVFTPLGEVRVLPRGSTPVDFAYEVHTEVGHRCVGARVNGKLVPLRYELQNGDTIEIMTATQHRPSKDWLKFVKTSKARERIRRWMKMEERERSITWGKEICEREFRKRGLSFNRYLNSAELQEVAESFSLRSVDDMLASIGYKKLSPGHVLGKLLPENNLEEPRKETIPIDKKKPAKSRQGVRVKGIDDIMVRLAGCCNPLPGEPIAGYITRGRGVTVHRLTCRNLEKGTSDRQIDVQWDSGEGELHPVDVHVAYSDEKGMLATLNSLLSQLGVNVAGIQMGPHGNEVASCTLRLEVKDTEHLQRVLQALRGEKNVYRVQRAME